MIVSKFFSLRLGLLSLLVEWMCEAFMLLGFEHKLPQTLTRKKIGVVYDRTGFENECPVWYYFLI